MKKTILKKRINKNIIKRYMQMLIGVTLLSLAYNIFILPNNFVYGGVSGLAIVVKRIFAIEPSLFILISSVLLLIISFLVLGKEKTMGSVVGSILYPIMVEVTSNVRIYLDFDTSQLLLAAIFGGILAGIGSGFIYKAGFSTGGTDITAQILHKYAKMSMGKSLVVCNGVVLLFGTFIFGINNFMYALIVMYLISMLADKVLLGISDSKAFYIITENVEEVKSFILSQLNHGVTIFNAKGGHNNKKRKVLFCVIPTKEYFKLKEGISLIDDKAFFVATDAYEVYGGE